MQENHGFESAHARREPLTSIGKMAREFKVSLRTLRFYEDRGLLHPLRNGVTRLYSDRDRHHLQLILKGRRLGFTLTEISTLLSEADANGPELHLAPDQIRAQIDHLERQRDSLDQAIAELRHVETKAVQTSL
jgi:DNA-binding transcriptional MerR regulator